MYYAQWSLNEPNFEYNETFVLCIMSINVIRNELVLGNNY